MSEVKRTVVQQRLDTKMCDSDVKQVNSEDLNLPVGHTKILCSFGAQFCFTLKQKLDSFSIFIYVEGSYQKKRSTQDSNKWAEQEAVLQTVEAPVRVFWFR